MRNESDSASLATVRPRRRRHRGARTRVPNRTRVTARTTGLGPTLSGP